MEYLQVLILKNRRIGNLKDAHLSSILKNLIALNLLSQFHCK